MLKQYITASLFSLGLIACTGKMGDSKVMEKMDDLASTRFEEPSDDASLYLLVGTYTSGDSEGIYVYQFDTVSGSSRPVSMVKVANPSYLTVSKDERFVYAVTENNEVETDVASAFSFNKKDGQLTFINSESTNGAAPCYITIDNAGRNVVTANYAGGSITTFTTDEDGLLLAGNTIKFEGKGLDPNRQTQPHLHCVAFSPDEKYLFANDLGTDKIYKFDVRSNSPDSYLKQGIPANLEVKSGAGPRHLEFHPNNKYVYMLSEISGTVFAFNYQDGNLSEIQTIRADSLNAQGSGDIHITPDGRFLYASNRLKGDGLAIFSINQVNGMLTKVGYQDTGIHPRNFAITPNGKFLLVACRDSAFIQVYEIDSVTGLLSNINKDIELDMPVCLKFASMK